LALDTLSPRAPLERRIRMLEVEGCTFLDVVGHGELIAGSQISFLALEVTSRACFYEVSKQNV
jgi:hypothetical protein